MNEKKKLRHATLACLRQVSDLKSCSESFGEQITSPLKNRKPVRRLPSFIAGGKCAKLPREVRPCCSSRLRWYYWLVVGKMTFVVGKVKVHPRRAHFPKTIPLLTLPNYCRRRRTARWGERVLVLNYGCCGSDAWMSRC